MRSLLKVNRVTRVLAILLFVVAPTISAQSDEVGRVHALIESVAQNMQEGNLAALDNLYSFGRGVHIIEGTGVNHGWVDYRDHHLKPELEAFKNLRVRYFAIEPQIRGEVAFSSFRYELIADTESGHIELEGRGTLVLEKLDGQWKIIHSHTSGRRK
jgi:ketosteroid isomerase-like protein